MSNFRELLQKHGLQVPDEKLYFATENAKYKMQIVFNEFVPNFKWLPEYDLVAEWLSDSKGTGLCLYGNCGRGKTLLIKYIIPAILLAEYNKVVYFNEFNDFRNNFDELIQKKIICLDDVGTEETINSFGNKRDIFPEIMDMVEKKSKLILFSSNLTKEKILERYGIRIYDRIKATTTRILFKGESLR